MKRCLRNILVAIIFVVYITPIYIVGTLGIHIEAAPGTSDTKKYLDRTNEYITSKISNPSYGSVGGEWAVMGLARYGKISRDYISIYKNNLKKKIEECGGNLSDKKYTEYARVTIALTSIGENPKDFYGYNLVKPLAELDHVKSQGANGIIYTLIALDCNAYTIPSPDGNYDGEITTREKLISLILNAELADGGWAYSGKTANADMTAMTIQALTPYYYKRKDVKSAVDKGIAELSKLQLSDGSFASGKTKTCESTAQVLTALSEMRISITDKRFVKNGNTVFDGLLQYYEDGGFRHLQNGQVNQMATEQAMYAMTAYYRSIAGKNRLYQMTDEKETIANTGNTKKQQKSTKKNHGKTSGKTKKKTGNGIGTGAKKTNGSANINQGKSVGNNNQGSFDGNIENQGGSVNQEFVSQTEGKKKDEKQEEFTQTETVIQIKDNGETIVIQKNQKEIITGKENGTKDNTENRYKTGIIILIILLAAGGGTGVIIFKKKRA